MWCVISVSLCLWLQQLSLLPLMEPVMGVNVSLFPPFGSSNLDRDSRLTGSFGSASLDGVTDYYSQLIYKVPSLGCHYYGLDNAATAAAVLILLRIMSLLKCAFVRMDNMNATHSNLIPRICVSQCVH